MRADSRTIDRLLSELGGTDGSAAATLFPRVYEQLRGLAGAVFSDQHARHTLQPTALVHEAYVKLVNAADAPIRNRDHFFMLAARVMRQILVDHARARNAAKRHAPDQPRTLIETSPDVASRALDVLDLEAALERLAVLDTGRARLVELRFFAGLSAAEAADVLGISRTQAARWWRMTRAWLAEELAPGVRA